MKDYKRLTEMRSGFVIDNCGNCPNMKNPQGCTDKKCNEIKKNRLAELEDKIDSGELVDRNEYLDHLMAAKDTSALTDKEIEFFQSTMLA